MDPLFFRSLGQGRFLLPITISSPIRGHVFVVLLCFFGLYRNKIKFFTKTLPQHPLSNTDILPGASRQPSLAETF